MIIMAEGTVFGAVAQENRSTEKIYSSVDIMPVFANGGEKGLQEVIRKNLHYPNAALSTRAEGRVFVSFVVDNQGRQQNVRIEKGMGPVFDQEALRVVDMLDHWQPAIDKGKPVAYRFIIPVKFEFPEEGELR